MNNRIIKFRAWDKKNKQWLLGYELPNLGGFSLMGEVMMMGEWAALLSSRFNDLDNIEVMQFTGLLDKSGKEIYEGDLVRMKQENWNYAEHLMCIEWSDRYASFQAMVVSTLGNAPGTAKVGVPYSMEVSSKNGEVIGNIFENPTLLGVTQ